MPELVSVIPNFSFAPITNVFACSACAGINGNAVSNMTSANTSAVVLLKLRSPFINDPSKRYLRKKKIKPKVTPSKGICCLTFAFNCLRSQVILFTYIIITVLRIFFNTLVRFFQFCNKNGIYFSRFAQKTLTTLFQYGIIKTVN